MSRIDIDLSKYDSEFHEEAMKRLMGAARVIRDSARVILASKLKGNWQEHGRYKSYINSDGKLVPYSGGGPSWTIREKGAMVKTIRAVRSNDKSVNNVLVIAGNFNTWWATQLEYGRGAWRGGAKSFMRPALKGANSRIIGILEGGALGEEVIR